MLLHGHRQIGAALLRSTVGRFLGHEAQQETAVQLIEELNEAKIWNAPIVTEVTPFAEFYVAEDYHQNYYVNNPGQGYCRVVVAPKVAKFRKKFSHLQKS